MTEGAAVEKTILPTVHDHGRTQKNGSTIRRSDVNEHQGVFKEQGWTPLEDI